jgi:hypothetical protein
MEISKRYRVNISTSVKGVVTPDQTVEITAAYGEGEEHIDIQELILAETASLHAALSKQYPTEKA